MFHGERRERMYREIERNAEARHWRAALEAARNFIQAFPKCVDADAIRAMIPTMEDNARIEEVRELRDLIRDLIQRPRYAEAVTHAEDILRRFPDEGKAKSEGRAAPPCVSPIELALILCPCRANGDPDRHETIHQARFGGDIP